MTWPPSDPKLAREASTLLAEIELAVKRVTSASENITIPFDFLGRLLSIGLPVIPEHAEPFPQLAAKFVEELPPECAARRFLERYFRSDEPLGTKESVEIYRLLSTARWYSLGCPAVTLERNLAASLMTSETAEELIDTVRPPWDCFMVRLPDDLIEEGGIPFTHLAVHRHIRTFETARAKEESAIKFMQKLTGVAWGLYGLSKGDTYFARIDKLAVLLGKERGERFDMDSLTTEPLPEDRLFGTLARLVVGICHLAETPNALRRKSTKKKQHQRWRFSKLPMTTEYVLAPDVPVKFDCTEAIGAYIRGDRKALPRFQYLVRGHWRNQAHGPGRMGRKRIWIQPYWKGPEDMPRLFREHRFDVNSDSSD